MRRASFITTGEGLQPLYYGRLVSYFNKYLLSLFKIIPRLSQNLMLSLSLYISPCLYKCNDWSNFFHRFLHTSCFIWHNKIA